MNPAWKPFEAAILEAFDLLLDDGIEAASVPKEGDVADQFWYDVSDSELTVWLSYRRSFITGRPVLCEADGEEKETEVRARLWVKLCTDVASQKSGVLTSVLRGGFLRHLNLAAKKQYRRAGQKDSSVANGAVNFSAAR